ncbi:Leu/Val/Ile amino-acid permease [Wickerhamomyces ciferrii]|uniref:Leu/Val/Ile amino-acid permease n=1 Tax=Wickerhamomyces ciferrii (strain ATCC 14091 / BCRC 22168 / CBS 111 / JCM 3599 / NBRC 0793 / NRRL Y-1031 F-60-10) TaxID=1206466 RepID=K0KM51_WICCF|nr:Leu/Val/Ile amino-acid permease [Wickerhamomyces ciferrii]CCH46320.1 Leu/Val/Ile amino-acid permease [Wickerhamomyces ciferrii]
MSSSSDIKKSPPLDYPMDDLDPKTDSSDLANFETYQKPSPKNLTKWEEFKDSFKRKEDESSIAHLVNDTESQTTNKGAQVKKKLKTRHVAMIAVAGGCGTGLLVGNGGALAKGGPAGLIVSYIIIGTMMFSTMWAAGELSVAYSTLTGNYNAYCAKLVDPSLGFAVAWNYAINWFTVLPLELVTASMTIKFWNDSVNADIFVAIFYVLIVVVNFVGAKGYAEAEFILNTFKVSMILGFIILGLIIDTNTGGHIHNQGYIGGKYWSNPGAFANGFKGVCATFVTSAFSLGGTEFAVLSASLMKNPRKSITTAMKIIFYRILIVYFVSIIVVGLLVPYDSNELMGSSDATGAPVSPYVIAIQTYGIKIVPHMINAVILLAVLSVGNSALYSSARTFYSLAQQGFAPKWFDFVDKNERPLRAMMVSSIVGLFCFIAAYENQSNIFTWLLSISGLSGIFTWTTICMSHIRFRAGMKAQGFSLNELGFVCKGGIWTSYYAMIVNILIIVAQFWVALFPIGKDGKTDIVNFFQNYLGVVVLFFFYFGHKIYTKNWILFIPASEIDLVKDRTVFDQDIIKQEDLELEEQMKGNPMKKILNILF